MFCVNKIYKTSRNDIAMNIRFREDIYRKYKEIAKSTGHSFNGLVISAMHYTFDNMEAENVELERGNFCE